MGWKGRRCAAAGQRLLPQLETIKKISEQGIEFPVQYIMDAMKHTADSIQNRDDYKLADCLIYEWLEIITVYEEVVMECK